MAHGTCTVDGCEKPRRSRTWCSAHYSQWYSKGADPALAGPPIGRPPRRTDVDPCEVSGCDRPMRRRGMCPKHYAAFRRASVRDGTWSVISAPKLSPLVKTPCKWCGELFLPSRRNNLYCSTACKARRSEQTKQVPPCTVADCERPHYARGVCNGHYKQLFRAPSERRRLADGRENAENILRADIGDRDGWTCGICSGPIDQSLRYPDPMSQSLDHIVPVSKGGRHESSNVRIAHFGCNARRGNRD